MLGNQALVSDFECDGCNKQVNYYETQLAAFLGISRTVHKIKRKGGIPDFNSPGNKFTAKVQSLFGADGVIKISSNESFAINLETGSATITYEKKPYKPLQVFKALARIGFCMMSEPDLDGYSHSIPTFLLGNKGDHALHLHPLLQMQVYNLPSAFKTFAVLFSRQTDALMPRHLFVLFTGSQILQIPLPFHVLDERNYGGNFEVKFMLTFGYGAFFREAKNIDIRRLDHSSAKAAPKNEQQSLSFNFDPAPFNNLKAYNINTRTPSDAKLNQKEIAAMLLVPKGQRVTFPKNENNDKTSQ